MKKHQNSLTAGAVKSALRELDDPQRAATSARFFKTGSGQHGEGDRFLGIRVPDLRRVALEFKQLKLSEVARLLASRIHEDRFAALEILVAQYEQADARQMRACPHDFALCDRAPGALGSQAHPRWTGDNDRSADGSADRTHAALGSIDSRHETAMLGIVDMQIGGAPACYQALECWREIVAHREVGIDQHSRMVKRSYRQGSI